MRNKVGIGVVLSIVVIAGVAIFLGCIEKEEVPISTPTFTPTPTITPLPTIEPKFGEVPYSFTKSGPEFAPGRLEEWYKMELINHKMEVREMRYDEGYEIDIDVWIRNTHNLPVDWIEVDVEYINEWNQTYIDYVYWHQFVKPNEIDKTYTHTGGEYIPKIKEIHVWGHEHHPE